MNTHPYENKVAVVTGGTRGIGFAIASALLTRGSSVMVSGRSRDGAERAHTQLAEPAKASGAAVAAEAADVRRADEVQRLIDRTVQQFGGLDILINNAAVGFMSEVAEQPIEQWVEQIETNLNGVFYACRAAIPHLRRRGGGWIINIGSLSAKHPFAGGAGYSATKAGLEAFSEALMQELRYDDIRVTCVMPGSVRTGFTPGSDAPGTEWKLAADDVARVVMDLIAHDPRSLPSLVELRPARPRRK